jgi:hypothetical protein
MKVIWKKLDLKLWDNVSFKYFLSLEIQLYYQKNTIWLGEFMPPVITVSSSEEGWLRKYTTLIEEGWTSLTKIVLQNMAITGPAARKKLKCLNVLPCPMTQTKSEAEVST